MSVQERAEAKKMVPEKTQVKDASLTLRSLALSPVSLALAFFLVVNAILLQVNPAAKVDPDAVPVAKDWVWWAAHEYKRSPQAPDMVIMGSSVVMHPLWHGEADFRNGPVDLVADRQSKFMQAAVKDSLKIDISAFNFGLPGAMASDAFMVSEALFSGPGRAPRLVILGLTPRDMVDNKFNCAYSSRHFRYLSRFVDLKPYVELAMPQLWQRIGYLADEWLYVKGKSRQLNLLASGATLDLVAPLHNGFPPSKLNIKSDVDKKNAIYMAQVEKGFWIAVPRAPHRFLDAEADLKKRFKNSNDATFANQKTWLELFLASCKAKGIEVVLVNMPTTQIVKQIMPKGVAQRHVALLKEQASKNGFIYVDADLPIFQEAEDYSDWAHLSSKGGRKIFKIIAEKICSEAQIAQVLQDRRLAGQSKLGI